MIIGIDSAASGGKNVVSLCSTMNSTFSSVFTVAEPFSTMDDKMDKMMKLLCRSIEYYVERNSKTPREIIIFHSSCSRDQEISLIKYFIEPAK